MPRCAAVGAVLSVASPILFRAASAAVITVHPDGSGDYARIQQALDAASPGDTVLLGDGAFVGWGNRDLEFRGKPLLLRSQSGDPARCILDCDAEGSGLVLRGFVFEAGEDSSSIVEGITIRDGRAEET
jgi:hypothetical protein